MGLIVTGIQGVYRDFKFYSVAVVLGFLGDPLALLLELRQGFAHVVFMHLKVPVSYLERSSLANIEILAGHLH